MAGSKLTKGQAVRLRRADDAGHYTFRADADFAKLERLGLVFWKPTRGVSDDVGRFHQTDAGRAALAAQQKEEGRG